MSSVIQVLYFVQVITVSNMPHNIMKIRLILYIFYTYNIQWGHIIESKCHPKMANSDSKDILLTIVNNVLNKYAWKIPHFADKRTSTYIILKFYTTRTFIFYEHYFTKLDQSCNNSERVASVDNLYYGNPIQQV